MRTHTRTLFLCLLLCAGLLFGLFAAPEAAAAGELSARRALTQEELDALNASLDFNDNGFFVTSYARPEEIDWAQVFYNGAGLKVMPSEAQMAAYESHVGYFMTSMVCIPQAEVARFVLEKTGTEYRAARRPLSWYLTGDGLYMTEHGDTNAMPIQILEGSVAGNEYELIYLRGDWENYRSERPFVLRARIEDGRWLYRSNLPADAAPPLPLLSIRFAESREEAQSLGAAEFVEVQPLPAEEPAWCWAVITALEDGVRFSLDRAEPGTLAEEYLAEAAALQIPDQNLTSGLLGKGESLALWVNRAWHPRLRLMATLGNYYGEYWFGEENGLHLDKDLPTWLTGHDLDSEGRGCDFGSEADLVNFLADGPWAWLDPETGELLAAVRFFDYRTMLVETMDASYQIFLRFDRIYTGETEAPDLLQLTKYYEEDESWHTIPSWFGQGLGDYLVSAVQLDGEQLLTLTQANNGDGVLNYILPGAGEYQHEFELLRLRGTAVFEGQG